MKQKKIIIIIFILFACLYTFNDLIIQNIPNQNPVVAKQHYHKPGTLRWFEIYFVFTNDIQSFLKERSPKIHAGQLLIVLKQQGEIRED